MDTQDWKLIEIEEEDDVLDDLMRLLDEEQRAVFCSYRYKIASQFLADRRERLKELLIKSQDTLDSSPNSTFSSSNLPKCRPCSVRIVDCNKYPQYYEREYKIKSLVTLDEDIIDVDEIENFRQDSFRNEEIDFTQDQSKSQEEFNTAQIIAFSGGEKFVNDEIYKDNQRFDLQVQRRKAQTKEIEQGLGQLNNDDQNFNGSHKTCNVVIKSRPLYDKHHKRAPELPSINIDNYWSTSKSQDNLDKNMIESKKISKKYSENPSTANKVIDKRKQLQNKCYSLSKGGFKMKNSINFNQRNSKNINQIKKTITWVPPILTETVPEKVIEERVPVYHENCPYRIGCQKTFKSSRRIIPHYHEYPTQYEKGNGRKNAKTGGKKQNRTTLKHLSNFNTCYPLNYGHVNENLGQNKSVDDRYIVNSNELHYGVNNSNNNHIFDISQANSVSNNRGVCNERNSFYKYIDPTTYNKKLIINSGGSLISQRPETFRSLDEERSLYQFNSSYGHESIFSPFFLTSLDCNVYDTSNNSQNIDIFPITSSERMINNNVNEVESISTRSNETFLEKYKNFLKNINSRKSRVFKK